MPCLNEAETLAICIRKANSFLNQSKITGEVLIADNGSTDGSQAIAKEEGARVVAVVDRGYGAALVAGINAAAGKYTIMGDADDSYDFSNLMPFVERLRNGADLVMGNRFQGGISPGAMPFLHRFLGNPVLSAIGKLFFKIKVGDFHCGLRGFNTSAIEKLNLRTTGMEFASEMVVKSALSEQRIEEVPTTLRPDGRSRPPHLRTWRDGWRHLSFLLMYSPRWLFFYPGLVLTVLGLVVALILLPGQVMVDGIGFDIHSFIVACFTLLIGTQALSLGVVARRFSSQHQLTPPSKRYSALMDTLTLERILVLSAMIFIAGLGAFIWCLSQWAVTGFGPLEYSSILRILILSVTAIAVSMQGMMIAFLSAIIEIPVK